MKRAGDFPTLLIRNCQNAAMFSSGAMRNPVALGLGGYVQVLVTAVVFWLLISRPRAYSTCPTGKRSPAQRSCR